MSVCNSTGTDRTGLLVKIRQPVRKSDSSSQQGPKPSRSNSSPRPGCRAGRPRGTPARNARVERPRGTPARNASAERPGGIPARELRRVPKPKRQAQAEKRVPKSIGAKKSHPQILSPLLSKTGHLSSKLKRAYVNKKCVGRKKNGKFRPPGPPDGGGVDSQLPSRKGSLAAAGFFRASGKKFRFKPRSRIRGPRIATQGHRQILT